MSGARARLYVIPGSHACRAAILMLENKRIPYRLVTLPTGAHSTIVRLLGFPGNATPIRSVDGRTHAALALLDKLGTVPALSLGDERVQTNRRIARHLDAIQSEPPLFPAERAARLDPGAYELSGAPSAREAARAT